MSPKILVIGLDGASFNLLDPLLRAGKLPHLASLLSRGRGYYLESTVPANTPVAWTSMTTGKNPGKHGIFGFFNYDHEELHVVSSIDNRSLRLWDFVGTSGKSSLIINVPYTWPPRQIHGALACFDSSPANEGQSCVLAEPPSVDQYIKDHHFDRIATFHPDRGPLTLSSYNEIIELETTFTTQMATRFHWDLLFVVFMVTDRIIHFITRHGDLVEHIYQKIDEAIARLVQLIDLDHDQVYIVSDHGTKFFTQGYPIPALLRRQGLLYLKPSLTTSSLVMVLGKEYLLNSINKLKFLNVNFNQVLLKVLNTYRNMNRTRKSDAQEDNGLKPTLRSLVDKTKSPLFYYSEHSGIDVLLKINERLYPKDAKRRFLQHILQKLNPTEKTIIKKAWVSEDLYSGPHLQKAPDIIIELNDQVTAVESPLAYYQKPQIVTHLGGGHRRRGILIAAGNNIASTKQRTLASIYDITPTILHSLFLPIPHELDGRVLSDLYKPDSPHACPPEYIEVDTSRPITHEEARPYTREEETEIQLRLQKLGYL